MSLSVFLKYEQVYQLFTAEGQLVRRVPDVADALIIALYARDCSIHFAY
ncbi:MAG: hypothetical protein KDE54_27660 [Caldilineaceae bacterium]|nr:hypothetical protein [Caldilineaceae bacterium]MCB0143769.1 hypothetical protein [Caldilineaceae bacterium]